jgi:hypothetical protein
MGGIMGVRPRASNASDKNQKSVLPPIETVPSKDDWDQGDTGLPFRKQLASARLKGAPGT